MKRIYIIKITFIILLQLAAVQLFSQVPSLINYQGTVRDGSGSPAANQTISLKFEFKQNNSTVFTETQSGIATNELGLFSTQIGKNTSLSSVNWQSGNFFLEVSVDLAGGSSFTTVGQQQLVSVPYALAVPASYTNNVLTIGGQSFTLSTSTASSPQATITSSGIGTITSAGTNSFDINVPATNLTGAGSATVSGAFPNYTIATPANAAAPQTSITSSGIGTVTSAGTNSFDINIPATSIISGTNVTVNGGYPNYTISSTPSLAINNNLLSISGGNTISLPASANASLVGSGAAQVVTLSPNSYSIDVPNTTIVSGTNVTVNGAYPNFTVSSTPTLNLSGNNLSISGSNTVTLPAQAVPTIVSSGVASVSSSGNSFTVDVPAPVYNPATGDLTTAGATANITPSVSLSGNTLTVGPPTNTLTLPIAATPSIIGTGAAVVTPTTGYYFSVDVPASAVTATGGIATVTSAGTNSFDINVPSPSYNASSGDLTMGTGLANITPALSISGSTLTVGPASNTVSLPAQITPTIIGTGATTVSGTYPSLTINSPSTSLTGIGSTTVSGAFPNYTIATPPIPSPTVTGTGLATVSPTTGTSFIVNVPTPVYTPSTGALAFGINTVGVSPQLTFTNNVLTSGASSNSVNLSNVSPWNQSGGTVSISASTVNVGIGTTTANALLTIDNQSVTSRDALFIRNARDQVGAGIPVQISAVTSGQTYGSSTYGRLIRLENVTLNTLFDIGIDQTNSFFLSRLNVYSPFDFVINSSGNIGIGNSSPSEKLDVGGNVRFSGALMPNNSAGTSGQFLQSAGAGAAPTWVSAGMLSGGTASYIPKWSSSTGLTSSSIYDSGTGIGIATTSPNGDFHVNSTGSSVLSRLTSSGATTGLVTYIDGSSASLLNYQNTPLYFGTNGANRVTIAAAGNVGIGTGLSPTQKLQVDGNISLDDASGGAPSRIIGFPTANPGNHGSLTIQAKNNVNSGTAFTGGDLILAGGNYNFSGAGGPYGGNVTIRTGTNTYDGSGGSDIVFQAAGGGFTERMRIVGKTGYIGIGVASPSANLHVAGTMRYADGNQANGKVLTSDANGNATWQSSSAPSKVRSINIIPSMFNASNLYGGVNFANIGGWVMPCLQFPDGNAGSEAIVTLLMPSDWNGGAVTCKMVYSTTSASGNVEMSIFQAPIALGQTVSQAQSGAPTAIGPSSSSEYLMEATITLSSIPAGTKILNFLVWRNGTSGGDTNSGNLNLYGIRLEYND